MRRNADEWVRLNALYASVDHETRRVLAMIADDYGLEDLAMMRVEWTLWVDLGGET